MTNPADVLREILAEAEEIIRRRLEERGLKLPYVVFGVTAGGEILLTSNVPPNVLRSFGDDLKNIADRLEASPTRGDTTHWRSASRSAR
ncbi:hypothetical protein [Reyranella soli]|uniref:Uncharacterized protein n=1 Tax=Reyranella soli TaxID=1230389 RepID=A0A512NQ23_9HYPH|nr:hypothetical protein [Reyranella soli]GEP61048.1 hypothetical protein RSO01_82140 [Reyranella soli]